jgi:hypothetical protein
LQQYERTAVMVDLSDQDFYVLDVFRVVGGTDHVKFMHSHFGRITPHGLELTPTDDYGHGVQMREFRIDATPASGWSVDWEVEDRYGYLERGAQVHLRVTDLTRGAEACLAEGWVMAGIFNTSEEAWIPRLLVRRRTDQAPLASTFVSVIEPYERTPGVAGIRRLPLEDEDAAIRGDADVAVEVARAGGGRDLIVAADTAGRPDSAPAGAGAVLVQPAWRLRLAGELAMIRRSPEGEVNRIVACRAREVRAGDLVVRLKPGTEFVEIRLDGGDAFAVSGGAEAVEEIRVGGRVVRCR